MHIWTAITGVAACMGRRAYHPWGPSVIWPNQYTILIGPPAVRKSTAANIMRKRLELNTGIRMMADDSGGQRQGLIKEMENLEDEEQKKKDGEKLLIDGMVIGDVVNALKDTAIHVQDLRDKHVMMAIQSEFASLVGYPDIPLLTFFTKVYDGEDYRYRLKSERAVLEKPLLTMLACTQPDTLAKTLPMEAIGQGFTSRIMFVYGNKKYKIVDRPPPLPSKEEAQIDKILTGIFNQFDGEISHTPAAEELRIELNRKFEVKDPRFIYYAERRNTHMIKLCMALAASRRDPIINEQDVTDAQHILQQTEMLMPEAFGEYGMNATSLAKQRIIEFLRAINDAASKTTLWAVMSKDIKKADFETVINDLRNAGKIEQFQNKNGQIMYVAVDIEKKEEFEAVLSLAGREPEKEREDGGHNLH